MSVTDAQTWKGLTTKFFYFLLPLKIGTDSFNITIRDWQMMTNANTACYHSLPNADWFLGA